MPTFHICHAEPCEHALKTEYAKAQKWSPNAVVAIPQPVAKGLTETLERYRSELANLRAKLPPSVPSTVKAEEV